MKLISTITTILLLLVLPVFSKFASFLESDQSPIGLEDKKVPGSNPLTYCSDPANNILQIESINLVPNPPKAYVSL
jgi:hypothetical protein